MAAAGQAVTVLNDVRYAEATVPLRMDPITAGAELTRSAGEGFVLYERPDEVSIGFGAAAEIVLTRSQIRFRGPRRGDWTVEPMPDEPLHRVSELLAECGVDGWRAYGWLGFELSYLRFGRPEVPDGLTLGHLVVPSREVRLGANTALLRALRWDDLAELHDQLERLREPAGRPVLDSPVDDAVDHDGYRDAVASAVAEIRADHLRKVVLSRVVPVPDGIDLAATYQVGRRSNTPVRSFLLDLGGLRSAGFSPETLLEARGDGTVSTQPLAGTRALSGDPSRDAALRDELMNDAKEVFEHVVSVRAAQEELRAVCREGSVLVEEFMTVGCRGSVQHLASRVTGKLADARTGWHALARMFPAVTVSGLPKPAAYQAIARYEREPRGLYGGVVVTADAHGALDAAVVLRAVYQCGERTWLRSGAGVVAQSRPDREFEETREKLRSIAPFLVPAPVATVTS